MIEILAAVEPETREYLLKLAAPKPSKQALTDQQLAGVVGLAGTVGIGGLVARHLHKKRGTEKKAEAIHIDIPAMPARPNIMHPATAAALYMGVPLAAAMGGVYMSIGEKNRERVGKELRDPRLYSNLRGVLESAEDRVKAHKLLDRRKDHTVLSAMREGFTRGGGKKEAADVNEDSGWKRYGEAAKRTGAGVLGFGLGLGAGAGAAHLTNLIHKKVTGVEIPVDGLRKALPLISGVGGLAYALYKAQEQEGIRRALEGKK